ncbi:sporulation histidine kinase inhibitor Sda [Paenibacillus pinisoli]|uniref:Sporulation histidine kinase inhibitor Sda n=1 Tax=Paenibacillus pinisoli TaxID=1276110 RepID=A0A3A6PHZ6_9BACL|nr:sporulation histidine kinase inhibitor Sda [Paenibacillus pinisoli]RJX39346.1 sporulation histidine kinase inhibitor Sda [Paenibacillus pinisoli]
MDTLSDELLVDTYYAAIEYKLDPEFIRMLAAEMKRRGVDLSSHKNTA